MSTLIEIKNLTKRYGQLTALDNLNLTVEKGAIVGFIGPNGAGKTTTMRILTTLLKPTSGEAWIAGHSVLKDPLGVRKVIGYMPDFFGVYEDMKVWEYLDFFAACYEIPASTRTGMIDDLLALVDLSHKKDSFVDSLSRGMKQRLCLARTLAHDPLLLILDEPASGLDPRARIEMRELLREMQGMGKTIFFSSHILSEIAEVCSDIVVLEAGKLVAQGNIAQMQARMRANRAIRVQVLGSLGAVKAQLSAESLVTELREDSADTLLFGFAGDNDQLSQLLSRLVQQNIPILSFHEQEGDLEALFMHVTTGKVQ